jgi:hypothetical protein
LFWQFYTWDYDPNAAFFGAQKGAEVIHVQMNLPDLEAAVVNLTATPITDATVTAQIVDLTGKPVAGNKVQMTVPADATTPAFKLAWPADPAAYLAKLELRDRTGKLLSENFYWHARDEKQLMALNRMPMANVSCSIRQEKTGVVARLENTSATPALMIRLTLRDAGTGQRILPVYYGDNYISLLPGESREIRIESGASAMQKLAVTLNGWNIDDETPPLTP